MATSSNHVNVNKSDAKVTKPCRSCLDFKTWRANMQQKSENSQAQQPQQSTESRPSVIDSDCPVDKDELGRSTWSFLHTMAAYYPDKPTDVQQLKMKTFMHLFSDFYPCEPCAADLREQMRNNPPDTSSQRNFSQWLCRIHNGINQRLGKPLFDCLLVDERWRDGWKDGRCD